MELLRLKLSREQTGSTDVVVCSWRSLVVRSLASSVSSVIAIKPEPGKKGYWTKVLTDALVFLARIGDRVFITPVPLGRRNGVIIFRTTVAVSGFPPSKHPDHRPFGCR